MRIGICHKIIRRNDGVAKDIYGMYDLLNEMGFPIEIIGEDFYSYTKSSKKIKHIDSVNLQNYDLLIYHHSMFWLKGEKLLEKFSKNVIIKYHSLIPAHDLITYSKTLFELSSKGYSQTKRLINKNYIWLVNTEFERKLLISDGLKENNAFVIPPFNLLITNFVNSEINPVLNGKIKILFNGAFSLHNNHTDLIKIINIFKKNISDDIILNLNGTLDVDFKEYFYSIEDMISNLNLKNNIKLLVEEEKEKSCDYLEACNIYLNLSNHPSAQRSLIAAQSIGLPVISCDTNSCLEILGSQQLCAPYPKNEEEYYFYALLINEVCGNNNLRRTVVENGYRNIDNRFTNEMTENSLVEIFEPFLRECT